MSKIPKIVSGVSMKLVLQFYSFRISRWEESDWKVREVTVASPSCRPGARFGEWELFSPKSEAASSSLRTGQIHRGCKGSFGGLEDWLDTSWCKENSMFLFYLLSAIMARQLNQLNPSISPTHKSSSRQLELLERKIHSNQGFSIWLETRFWSKDFLGRFWQ